MSADPVVHSSAPPAVRSKQRARTRILPFLITLVAAGTAALLGWAMWKAYMLTPWTRDGTVRVYVATVAPEVPGRIVESRVVDNQLVHKGDLLLVIDPTDYRVAVQLSEATVRQAQADVENIEAQITMQEAQVGASQAQVESAQAALTFAKQQAARYRDLAENSTDGAANRLDPWPGASGAQECTGQPHARSQSIRVA
jgi:multidrug resistance efflux pump